MMEEKYTIAFNLLDDDWEKIRQWRNSQPKILRDQRYITPEEQMKYVSEYRIELATLAPPKRLLVGLMKGGDLIGYGGFVHIKWNGHGDGDAETSFLVKPSRKENLLEYANDYINFLRLLRDWGKLYRIKKWRSETLMNTGDPTRDLHVCLHDLLFDAVGDTDEVSCKQFWAMI